MRQRASRVAKVVAAAVALVGLMAGCSEAAPEIPSESPPAVDFDDGARPSFATDMVSCMSELGWDVSLGADNSFKTDNIPEGQESTHSSDQETCLKEFGYDQIPPSLSEDQVKATFPHHLWEWKCLNEAGYEPEAPPSERKYVEDYLNNGVLWSAYGQYTATLSEEDLLSLFEECPRSGEQSAP